MNKSWDHHIREGVPNRLLGKLDEPTFHLKILTFGAIATLSTLFVQPTLYAQQAPVPGETKLVVAAGDPTSMQREIMAAYKAGQRRVLIPPGVYPISAPDGEGSSVKFEDLHDFEIDAWHVTFLMADQTKGSVLFRNCRNVTFRGATIRNATPAFTQGTIESVALTRMSCEVRIDAGYPTKLDDPAYFKADTSFYLFDAKTHLLKEGSTDSHLKAAERLGSDRFRLEAKSFLRTNVAAGDRFALPGKGGAGMVNEGCGDMVFEDITVEYAGGFGFFELWGDGRNVYRRITVQPGPKPAGATEEPLLSEPGDAFHSTAMRRGPTVEDSFLTRMGDDGIAIHGYFLTIREVQGNKLTVSQGKPMDYFRPGDHLEAISKTGVPMGTALVTSSKLLPDDTLPRLSGPFRALSEDHRFSEIILDHELPVSAGDFAEPSDRLGSGFTLRGNTIKDHRARGMMLKACDGLVEDNFVIGSSVSGIAMIPQLWWGEAGFCQNVVIRGNTITHVGYATVSRSTRQAGAISVVGELKAPEARGHRNITIENNVIQDTNGVNLELDGIEGCTLRGNRFLRPQQKVTDRGSDEVDTEALIFINRAKNVHFENNTVEKPGPANKGLIKITPNATDISGTETGIRVLLAIIDGRL